MSEGLALTVELRTEDRDLAFRWGGRADSHDDAVGRALEDWSLAVNALRFSAGLAPCQPHASLTCVEEVSPRVEITGEMPPIWTVGKAARHLCETMDAVQTEPGLTTGEAGAIARALLATDPCFAKGCVQGAAIWLNAATLSPEADAWLRPIVGLSGNTARSARCGRTTLRTAMAIGLSRLGRCETAMQAPRDLLGAHFDATGSSTIAAIGRSEWVSQSPAPLRQAGSIIARMGEPALANALWDRADSVGSTQ